MSTIFVAAGVESMSDHLKQTREQQLADILARIIVSDPDADGLTWLTVRGETVFGSVSIPASSIQGQAFAEFKAMLAKAFTPKLVGADNASHDRP